jgi:membrane protein required for colicin V production
MSWVDWVIVLVIVLTVLDGLRHGFLRSICSLAGLVLGLALAVWNYGRLGKLIMFSVRFETVANTIAFLLIAVFVMGVASMGGKILSKTLHATGLGCLDKLAGGVFGFIQGSLQVMIVILVVLAFYPHARWMADAKLPRLFFGACHMTARMSPEELATQIRHGLSIMEDETPDWMHPGRGGA